MRETKNKALTLLAYLNVLSDLFTEKMKQCGNNSVSPVEEFDLNLNDSRAELELQETVNCQQNVKILKDHIR